MTRSERARHNGPYAGKETRVLSSRSIDQDSWFRRRVLNFNNLVFPKILCTNSRFRYNIAISCSNFANVKRKRRHEIYDIVHWVTREIDKRGSYKKGILQICRGESEWERNNMYNMLSCAECIGPRGPKCSMWQVITLTHRLVFFIYVHIYVK